MKRGLLMWLCCMLYSFCQVWMKLKICSEEVEISLEESQTIETGIGEMNHIHHESSFSNLEVTDINKVIGAYFSSENSIVRNSCCEVGKKRKKMLLLSI